MRGPWREEQRKASTRTDPTAPPFCCCAARARAEWGQARGFRTAQERAWAYSDSTNATSQAYAKYDALPWLDAWTCLGKAWPNLGFYIRCLVQFRSRDRWVVPPSRDHNPGMCSIAAIWEPESARSACLQRRAGVAAPAARCGHARRAPSSSRRGKSALRSRVGLAGAQGLLWKKRAARARARGRGPWS